VGSKKDRGKYGACAKERATNGNQRDGPGSMPMSLLLLKAFHRQYGGLNGFALHAQWIF
jgi:hypothetical protein